jgi:hypothetical protein
MSLSSVRKTQQGVTKLQGMFQLPNPAAERAARLRRTRETRNFASAHRRKFKNIEENVKKVLTEPPCRDIISLLGV